MRGDGNLIPIEESIGAIPEGVREKIDYVGYFGGLPPARDSGIADEDRAVLVSSGGGVTRDSIIMFKRAIEARKFTAHRNRVWRIIVPNGCHDEVFNDIQSAAALEDHGGGIVVERNRKDFLELLSNAALLICHGGNTIIEAVNADIPVLAIPRDLARNNREQQIRAQAFYKKGLIEVAALSSINDVATMATKVDSAVSLNRTASLIRSRGATNMAVKITNDFKMSMTDPGDIFTGTGQDVGDYAEVMRKNMSAATG